jgi:hypothetical protein
MALSGSEMGVLSMTQGTILFVTLLPAVSDMRKASPDDESFKADVRTSEGIAAALTLGTGLAAGLLSHSRTPVLIAIGTVVLLVVVSELLLRQNDGAASVLSLHSQEG